MAVRYQDLMACMTTEVIGELEAGGYLTSVDGNAVTRPCSTYIRAIGAAATYCP